MNKKFLVANKLYLVAKLSQNEKKNLYKNYCIFNIYMAESSFVVLAINFLTKNSGGNIVERSHDLS